MVGKMISASEYCYLGADIEFFFKKPRFGIVPSEKYLPFGDNPLEGDNHTLHTDGFQGEVTAVHSHKRSELANNIWNGLDIVSNMAAKDNLVIDFSPSVTIKSIEGLDDRTIEFGCSPEFSAWNDGEMIPQPCAMQPIRTAGAHLHIGTTIDMDEVNKNPDDYDHKNQINFRRLKFHSLITNEKEGLKLIQMLDIILGTTSVLMAKDYKNERMRRMLYGSAGSFRFKPYGIEYRVLSPFFMKDVWIFNIITAICRNVVTQFYYGMYETYIDIVDVKEVQKIINDCDYLLARKIVTQISDIFIGYNTEPTLNGTKSLFEIIHLANNIDDSPKEDKTFEEWRSEKVKEAAQVA